MKQTDGLFHKVFDEIAAEYPQIENEHWIVDIGAAKLADTPERFDVIVMPNLYGDILSDVAAQIAGSVGLAGSANIGEECAMFEAIHGSAPRMVKDSANPSGLLEGAVMMLTHIGQIDVAEKIHNAWLRTIESGIHTKDLYIEGSSLRKVGTAEFAEAVIANLGQLPRTLKAVNYEKNTIITLPKYKRATPAKKTLVGVDLFVHYQGLVADELAAKIKHIEHNGFELVMITNRGIKVWPEGFRETFCTDHWRCRFKSSNGQAFTSQTILDLMAKALGKDIDVIKTENLYQFDGKDAYSLGQGQ
jgi:isocitrate dehydrogenase